MSFSTYAGLQSSIADWLNRTDLEEQIRDFIHLAENRISLVVRVPAIETTIIMTVNSDGYATIPSDFLEVKDVFYDYDPLTRVSLSEIHRRADRSGDPEMFARETYRLRLYPTPASYGDSELRMIYYYDVGRLTSTNTSHVMLELAPELYLYAALVEAADFLGTGQRDAYEAKYQMAYGRLMKHSRDAEFAGSTAVIQSGY
mgnify:CR=1 FL=1